MSFAHLGEFVRKATRRDRDSEQESVVAGIDVGSPENGFHLVAIRGAAVLGLKKTIDPAEASNWCREMGAELVAVDAPSGWCTSTERKCREAEEILGRMGYSSYPTPLQPTAVGNPNYAWMLNGERLYAALRPDFPLFSGKIPDGRFCFETYPYVTSCGLAGRKLRAENKNRDRRDILRAAGIDDLPLKNIHYVDAAICALAAQSVKIDYCIACGNAEEGFIIATCFH